mgnify:CR=1 FL=1
MAEHTKIPYVDATWNPVIGCQHATIPGTDTPHPGCANCFAECTQGRFGVQWGPTGTRRKTSEAYWKKPGVWERKAAEARRQAYRHARNGPLAANPEQAEYVASQIPPFRVMLGSMMDLFEDWRGPILGTGGEPLYRGQHVRDVTMEELRLAKGYGADAQPLTMADLRRDVFRTIDATPNVTYVVPTKRPQNVQAMWLNGFGVASPAFAYRHNVHLLYSASDQQSLDAGLPYLLQCQGLVPVLGLSLEPLVGAVDLGDPAGWAACAVRYGINRIVIGCEQLPGHTPGRFADGYEAAARSVIRQCQAASVRVYHKQMPIGGRVSTDPSEWPEDLRVQELP